MNRVGITTRLNRQGRMRERGLDCLDKSVSRDYCQGEVEGGKQLDSKRAGVG